jgi:hypothetical protein
MCLKAIFLFNGLFMFTTNIVLFCLYILLLYFATFPVCNKRDQIGFQMYAVPTMIE